MDNLIIGHALIYGGDPTQANGAGMILLGETRDAITVNPQVSISHGKTDSKGGIPLLGTGYTDGGQPMANLPLIGNQKDQLNMLLPGSTLQNDVLSFGSRPRKLTIDDYNTLCIIPVDEVDQGANGIDAPNAIWFPFFITQEFGQFTYDLPEGDDNLTAFSRDTNVISVYHTEDQAASPIPEDARRGFRGSPNNAGLQGWSLPDHSANL